MDTLQSTRETIFKIANERDKSLHTLPTIADTHAVRTAIGALPLSLPEQGLGPHEGLGVILRDVLPALAPGHAGPRYFGFITGGTLPSSQLADFLTTIYDQNVGANRTEDSIAAVIESRALEFVLDLLSLPRDRFPARTLTTAMARDHAVRLALGSSTHSVSEDGFGGIKVKVYTDRPHASLLKAAAIVGIGRANVIDLGKNIICNSGDTETTQAGSEVIGIDIDELEELLKEATPGSGTAAVVSLSFGEVNTGDFTPNVRGIRALCDKYSVWLHIDAAFGAYGRLVPDIIGPIADGLELADSIASDAHKWLNVPYDCGIFFSCSIAHQSSIFGPSPTTGLPAYLARPYSPLGADPRTPELSLSLRIPDPMILSIENSRRFRALPLYAALLDQGREGYTRIIRRNILFTRQIAAWMVSPAGRGYYEVLNLRRSQVDPQGLPPTTPLNMLLFRAAKASNPVGAYVVPGGEALLVRAINETRKVHVTPGAGAVRIAVSNWCTGLHLSSVADGDGKVTEKGDFDILVDVLLSVVEHPPAWIHYR